MQVPVDHALPAEMLKTTELDGRRVTASAARPKRWAWRRGPALVSELPPTGGLGRLDETGEIEPSDAERMEASAGPSSSGAGPEGSLLGAAALVPFSCQVLPRAAGTARKDGHGGGAQM